MRVEIARRGLVLLGCGKMGSAMLEGWLERGLPPDSVWVTDPHPSDWLKAQGVHLNEGVPDDPGRRADRGQAADDGRCAARRCRRWAMADALSVGRRGHADRDISSGCWARARP